MFMRPAMEADLQAIKKIYMEAFPLVERAPFSRIIKQWRSGELDILTFREEDNSLIGFSINASEADLVLIDYLAISPAVRGGGYGSKALELMHLYYLGKRIFLIIQIWKLIMLNSDPSVSVFTCATAMPIADCVSMAWREGWSCWSMWAIRRLPVMLIAA